MSASRKRSTDDHELVARINSEHLSDQFQRELSNTPEDDLLQDRELKLDDIHSASGSSVAALMGSQQPAPNIQTDMLASVDASDDNWLVASPYTSPTVMPPAGANRFHADGLSNSRAISPEANGNTVSKPAGGLERSPSKALTDAYAQPSKIPRFTQANTSAGSLQRQASREPAIRSRTQPVTRLKSGALRDSKLAAQSPSKSKGPKPPVVSPPQSISDTGEDGQPVWRAITKPPAPKYTQQTDIALGGPFERSSSQQLPRANSTQRANSNRPRSRPNSRPGSAKPSKPPPPAQQGNIQLTQEPTISPFQSATPIQEPSTSPFQSRIPAAPRASDAAAEPISSDAGLASGLAQPMGDTQQGQLDGAALQQQHQQPPAAEEVQVQQQADVQQQPHLNGLDQHSREADAAPADKEQLPAGTDDDLSAQQPVSPDQIDIGVKPPGESADGQAGAQHAQTPQEEQKQKKKMAKCCCCVIM